jgi:hypothetical protein
MRYSPVSVFTESTLHLQVVELYKRSVILFCKAAGEVGVFSTQGKLGYLNLRILIAPFGYGFFFKRKRKIE